MSKIWFSSLAPSLLMTVSNFTSGQVDCGNILSHLQFKNSGVVKSSMLFEYRRLPCYYMEDVDAWSTPWSNATYQYLYEIRDGQPITPPSGIRSAVPLGGLGAGTIELRADGSLRDWNIFNNSPAGGGGKVHLDEAVFGLRTQVENGEAKAWVLRTHPPAGLSGIAQIEYSGAFPVSRLRFADDNLPLAVELYAYCEFRLYDPEGSATPAVIFTFNLHNPSEKSVEVSLMFNLPNHIGGNFSSSQKGLTLSKAGTSPTSGNMALRIAEANLPCSWLVSSDLPTVWEDFSKDGKFSTTPIKNKFAQHGALATSVKLASGQFGMITFVLSWYFPYRPHAGEILGNYYTKLYSSAEDVADKVIARLPDTWQSIYQWQRLCFDNSLPEWLQDAMVNSVATIFKTGMWFADGRFRQWESFCCPAVEPIHIHFYRSLPYVWFFPSLHQNLLKGFASAQADSGYIEENLGDASVNLDVPKGRQMGDSCTTFILAVYQNYLWTGDKLFLDSLWQNVKKAILWQIERCRKYGLPDHLNNTYDWWDFERKDLVSYNAFLHMASMLAAEKLAKIQSDEELASACLKNLQVAQKALDKYFWTGEYFRSWFCHDEPFPDALHADTLYGQLWACILDLGLTTDKEKIVSHLAAEMKKNSSPFGLKVMQGTSCDDDRHPDVRPGHAPYENGPVNSLVWQAGSLDWASLNIYMDGDVEQSLNEAKKVIEHWRKQLCDQWNYRDLTTSWDGNPWCNSHYSRQLILWALPLALSGQRYDSSQKRLHFQPKLNAPTKLPFFTPVACGTLELVSDRSYKLTVLVGELELSELQIGKDVFTQRIRLKAGESFAAEAR